MAIEVPLVGGSIALVDDEDFALVSGEKWLLQRIPNSSLLYARRSGPYTNTSMMHRMITGVIRGQHVDHLNSNGLDNRRENLRVCTHTQNMANRPKQRNSTQPYKGIRGRFDKPRPNPWVAFIGKEGTYLGSYATPEEAARAYDAAATKRYGQYARLNFPAG